MTTPQLDLMCQHFYRASDATTREGVAIRMLSIVCDDPPDDVVLAGRCAEILQSQPVLPSYKPRLDEFIAHVQRLLVRHRQIDAIGDANASRPMTTEQLVAAYSSKLKGGARRMLDLLVEAYPNGYTRNDLSAAADVIRGGTFSSYLSSLVTNGLAEATRDAVTASPSLFLANESA